MFDQFKEKIHSVQQDLNAGLKSLSEKAREVGRSKKLPGDLHVLDSKATNLSVLKPESIDAGEEILNRFQQLWTQIHINIEFCAEKAVKTDKVIQELVQFHESQLQAWKQLHSRVQEVPDMVSQIQAQAATLGKLEANFEEIESMLNILEDTCEEEELLHNKKTQVVELTRYREQKAKERELRRERLMDEYNQMFRRLEDKEDAKKKERQKTFQDVFAADMDHYRTHGQMSTPVTHSSAEQENKLDEFEIAIGADDQQALDDFLGPDDDDDDDDDDDKGGRGKTVTTWQHQAGDDSDEEDEEVEDKEALSETSLDSIDETTEEERIDVTKSERRGDEDTERRDETIDSQERAESRIADESSTQPAVTDSQDTAPEGQPEQDEQPNQDGGEESSGDEDFGTADEDEAEAEDGVQQNAS